MNKLEDISDTPVDNDVGYFIEVDLKYPDNMKGKTRTFPFAPGSKTIHKDEYKDYMKKIQPKSYTKSKKVICDWTDRKKYLIQNRMFKIFVGHGMIVGKIHEIISFKQNKWL